MRLEAALVTLEILPARDLDAEVIVGEEPGSLTVCAGEPRAVRGAPEVEIQVDGLGRIRASGPVGDVEALRAARDHAEAELARRTRDFGTADVEELARREARATRLDDTIGDAERALEGLLEGGSLDAFERSLATHRERIKAILEGAPEWTDAPPDVEAIETEAKDAQDSSMEALRAAERGLDLARTRTEAARAELETATGALATLDLRLGEDREELARLRKSDGLADAARVGERDDAALENRAATARLERAREQMAVFGEDPTAARDRRRATVQECTARLREREQRITALQIQVTAMAGSGSPQRELALAEEKLAALDARIQRGERRMEAVKLLRRLVEEEEQRRLDGLVSPVERDAGAILRRIAGPRLGALGVGEKLRPDRIHPRAIRDGVEPDIDDLSGGEQEQVHFAVRLALAGFLARDARQLVVLDDVLAYSDSARYNHVLGILEELSSKLQIVILTCHPERYGGLAEVHFDLESLTV